MHQHYISSDRNYEIFFQKSTYSSERIKNVKKDDTCWYGSANAKSSKKKSGIIIIDIL